MQSKERPSSRLTRHILLKLSQSPVCLLFDADSTLARNIGQVREQLGGKKCKHKEILETNQAPLISPPGNAVVL